MLLRLFIIADKFDMIYGPDGRVKITSCAYPRTIIAHPTKLTVDGIVSTVIMFPVAIAIMDACTLMHDNAFFFHAVCGVRQ